MFTIMSNAPDLTRRFEDEQMMCRPGCKCEQQYRLHRLLAFDPNNECRGIFSDWFRFPSYCVCECRVFYLPSFGCCSNC